MIITYIILLYLQHDKILNLLAIHRIIVIVIILIVIILIIIINAFIFSQTSLAMHEKKIVTILCNYLTYKTEKLLIVAYTLRYLKNLQYTVITY